MSEFNAKFIDTEIPIWKPGDECGGAIFDPLEDDHYGSAFPEDLEIDEDEWKDRVEDQKWTCKDFNLKINNQNPESSCVFNGSETALRTVLTMQLGVLWSISLSPMSRYGPNTRSRHSGYNVWQALEDLVEQGMLPEDTPKNRRLFGDHVMHQNTPFTRRVPEGSITTGQLFCPAEWYRISTKKQFGSALLNDMPVVYGRNGHCICALWMAWQSSRNRPLAGYAQSYGIHTGDEGYQYDSMGNWSTSGSWALGAMKLPPAELIEKIRALNINQVL